VSAAGEERARLDARAAELREKVSGLLGEFESRTERLRQAQQAAAVVTATLTSPDGLVRVTVDATGMVTELHLAPSVFDRTRPDALARTLRDLLRRAASQVRRQTSELMRPLTEDLPDLSDISEGAPSLAGMLPKIPADPAPGSDAPVGAGYPVPDSAPPIAAPSPALRRPAPAAVEDEMPTGWMKDDDF
jgi:DNA-binding protein YbaB